MFEDYKRVREKQHLDFDIQPASQSNINEIAQLSLEREGGEFDKISTNIKSYLSNREDSFILVALVENRLVGFGKARYFQGQGLEFPGWYLAGMIVAPEYRQAYIGRALTAERLKLVSAKASEVYYFANASNSVTIELHQKLGFKLIQEPFEFPNVTFTKSHGQLYLKKFS